MSRRHDYEWNIQTFLDNFTFPPIVVPEDYIVLGDSIVRNVDNINNTQVISYPGSGLKKMAILVQHGKVPELADKTMVVIHLGTNDASGKGVSVHDLVRLTQNLVTEVRRLSPHAIIALSSIIPRPTDFETTNEKVKEYNNYVHRHAAAMGICTFPTYETLQKYGKPVQVYYKPDKLHLNQDGVARLRMCLSKFIAKERINHNLRRVNRRAPETIVRVSHAASIRRASRQY